MNIGSRFNQNYLLLWVAFFVSLFLISGCSSKQDTPIAASTETPLRETITTPTLQPVVITVTSSPQAEELHTLPEINYSINIPSDLPVISASNIQNLVEFQVFGLGYNTGYRYEYADCWSEGDRWIGRPTDLGVFLYDTTNLEGDLIPGTKGDVIQCSFLPGSETLALLKIDGSMDHYFLDQGRLERKVLKIPGEPVGMSADARIVMTNYGIWNTDALDRPVVDLLELNNGFLSSDGTRYRSGFQIWQVVDQTPQLLYENQDGFLVSQDLSIVILLKEGRFTVWDVIQKQEVSIITPGEGFLPTMISADNQFLLGVSENEQVIWKISDGKELYRLSIPFGLTDLTLGVGKLFYISIDGEMKLWDLATGEELVSSKYVTLQPQSVSTTADGNLTAFLLISSDVVLYDFEKSEIQLVIPYPFDYEPADGPGPGMAISSDGSLIGLGGTREALVWQLKDPNHPVKSKCHSTSATLAFSPDGSFLACGSFGAVDVTSTRDGSPIANLTAYEGWVSYLDFSADGRYLLSSSYDGVINIWETGDWKLIMQITGFGERPVSFAVAPDAAILAAGAASEGFAFWGIPEGNLLQKLPAGAVEIPQLAFSPDGSLLVASNLDGYLFFIDVSSGQLLHTLKLADFYRATSIRFVMGGKALIMTSRGEMRIWGVNAGD